MMADEWNAKYKPGTTVQYWPQGKGKDQRGEPLPCIEVKTHRRAYYLGTGTMVVPLEGHGAQPLSRIAIPAPEAKPVQTEIVF